MAETSCPVSLTLPRELKGQHDFLPSTIWGIPLNFPSYNHDKRNKVDSSQCPTHELTQKITVPPTIPYDRIFTMEYSRSPRRDYPVPRRVATAPIPLSAQFASPPSDGLVETLYNHPNAKIVSFTASGRAFSRSLGRSSGFPVLDDEPGTLSWSSQLERTIAVGKHIPPQELVSVV